MNNKIKYFNLLRPPMLLCRQPFSLILYNLFIACKIKTRYLQNIFSTDFCFIKHNIQNYYENIIKLLQDALKCSKMVIQNM